MLIYWLLNLYGIKMTTEIFKAGTQYNDFTGTSAAETQGFVEYLKAKI